MTMILVPRPTAQTGAIGRHWAARGAGSAPKIHLVAAAGARIISPGQHRDSPYFIRRPDAIRIRRRRPGRPRRRLGRVLADKAYSSREAPSYLRPRGIKAVTPEKNDQKAHRRTRGRAGGRRPTFNPERYK